MHEFLCKTIAPESKPNGNNLPNYNAIVQILENNECIQTINMRGSEMNPDNLGYIWLGIRQNTSIIGLEYQKEKVAFSFDILQAVEI